MNTSLKVPGLGLSPLGFMHATTDPFNRIQLVLLPHRFRADFHGAPSVQIWDVPHTGSRVLRLSNFILWYTQTRLAAQPSSAKGSRRLGSSADGSTRLGASAGSSVGGSTKAGSSSAGAASDDGPSAPAIEAPPSRQRARVSPTATIQFRLITLLHSTASGLAGLCRR